MRWIDSHCHLTSADLSSQTEATIERAAAAGVTDYVTVATDEADAARALALSEKFESVHVAAGVHPHEAGKITDGWRERLAEFAGRPDVYAVGEMGLDYHYDFAPPRQQRSVFERQLELAAELSKPVIIHCREAHADTMAVLSDARPTSPVVFHCFTGTLAEAEEIIAAGFWISLTGVVTFKKSDELREVARRIPADRMMVETDSPYLSPEPVRSRRPNEPAHVVHTGRCIAAARGETEADFAARMTENTIRFFGLPQRTETAG